MAKPPLNTEIVATICELAAEIGRRTAASHGRPEDWVNEKFIAAVVSGHAGEVLCDWLLGAIDAKKIVIVHILQHGNPLCRFRAGVPRDWPEGHKWVGIEDYSDANCPMCVRALHKLQGKI